MTGPLPEATIRGALVTLRPSTLADRRAVFEWLAKSDVTGSMMGPPLFPDSPPPTWAEFCEDHTPHFFDGSAPLLGRCFLVEAEGEAVGQIYYNDIRDRDGQRCVELDMWMRAERFTGKGYGSDAVNALCRYLSRTFGVVQCMMQPSARNPRAIRTYEKAGFERLPLSVREAAALWGPNDYHDSVYMVRTMPSAG